VKKLILSLFLMPAIFCTELLTEAKVGYLYPTTTRFRKVYGGGGLYGAELSLQLWRGLYLWAEANYFYKKTSSLGSHSKTEITLVPIPIGLKYLWKCSSGDFYLGAGGVAAYIDIRDHSPFVNPKTKTWGYGGIVRLGYIYNFKKIFFFSFFADSSWIYAHPHRQGHHAISSNKINVSNASAGVSFGFRLGPSSR
jgi:hypothetical protein